LLAAGNYLGVAADADGWRKWAALGLLGRYERALVGLAGYDGDDVRTHAALTRFVAGDEYGATRLCEELATPQARRLLALMRGGCIRVLVRIAMSEPGSAELAAALAADDLFEVTTVAFGTAATRGAASADGYPSDLYLFVPRGRLMPPRPGALPCPSITLLSDTIAERDALQPWIDASDALIVSDTSAWECARSLTAKPVVTFPKGLGLADVAAPPDGPRPLDVLLSRAIVDPDCAGRPRLAEQLALGGCRVAVMDGALSVGEVHPGLAQAKLVVTSAMPLALAALAVGTAVLVPPTSPLAIWGGEEDGILVHDLAASNLRERIVAALELGDMLVARGRRGAETVRREFARQRVTSEVLRLATVLAITIAAGREAT
jgi:hypothetical protein